MASYGTAVFLAVLVIIYGYISCADHYSSVRFCGGLGTWRYMHLLATFLGTVPGIAAVMGISSLMSGQASQVHWSQLAIVMYVWAAWTAFGVGSRASFRFYSRANVVLYNTAGGRIHMG